jgi:hypothetical protein
MSLAAPLVAFHREGQVNANPVQSEDLMRAIKLCGLAVGFSVLAATTPTTALADVVTFNFESLPVQSGLGTLTLTGGGLTATLLQNRFEISDLSASVPFGLPLSWGSRTLTVFDQPTADPFIMNFSQGIAGISVEMGDFGVDEDALVLQLFSGLNGTGTLLGTSSGTLPGGGFGFTSLTLAVNAMPALSARFIGASGGVQSVSYDNISVTFNPTTVPTGVPEPSTLVLMSSGLLGVGFLKRRRRN